MKFKIGDIVKSIYSDNGLISVRTYNKLGKIINYNPKENMYTVEFFENVGGHDGYHKDLGFLEKGKYGHCYHLPECYIEKYTFILKKFLKEKRK